MVVGETLLDIAHRKRKYLNMLSIIAFCDKQLYFERVTSRIMAQVCGTPSRAAKSWVPGNRCCHGGGSRSETLTLFLYPNDAFLSLNKKQ